MNDIHYKYIFVKSAEALITRFNPTIGCIRSWDHSDDKWGYPVIIYADDMGYGNLNCQNSNSKIPTPNLDLLASEGTRLKKY
jgi:hypothetical protein